MIAVVISIATLYNTRTEGMGILTPAIQIAYVNSDVEIQCFSPNPVKFLSPKGKLLSKEMVKKNILRLKKIKLNNSGNYTCLGHKDSFEAVSQLLVGGKMKVF